MMTLNPKNMEIGRRVSLYANGLVRRCEAVVTTRRDIYGWHVLKVDAPVDHVMHGIALKCDEYEAIEYVEAA